MTDPAEAGDLTRGPIGRSLFRMAGPVVFGLAAMMSIDVVDTYFIGQLGTAQLAAMGFAFPVIFLATAITGGGGTAVQSIVSRAVGDGDHVAGARVVHHGIWLAVVLTIVTVALGYAFMDPIFTALGAGPETLPHIRDYMEIWWAGLVFFTVPYVAGAGLMAKGDSLSPALFMIVGALLNMALDPILIHGAGSIPGMGIRGAALASVLSRGIVMLGTLVVLLRNPTLRLPLEGYFRGWISSTKAITRLGLPLALGLCGGPVTLAVVTAIVATFGEPAVAAYAAGGRIQALSGLIPASIGVGLSSIVGQNWGASLKGRVMRTIHLAELVAVIWGMGLWAALAVNGGWIASNFVDDSETQAFLVLYLLIVPASFMANGALEAYDQTLAAIDRPKTAVGLTVLEASTRIGFAFLAVLIGGYVALLGSMIASAFFVALISGMIVRRAVEREN